MTRNVYDDALAQGKADLIKAIKERDHWTLEVARLQQVINSLSVMAEKVTPNKISNMSALREALANPEIGLQEIIFTCMRDASPESVTPTQVRDVIRLGGLADLSKYANPLAVIHGALKRLATQNKIRGMSDGTYRMPHLFEELMRVKPPKLYGE